MFIVYGTKETNKTIGSGEFNCPNCTSEQPYWQKTVQEKGHLYWVSLLPLGKKLEYVQCRTCEEIYQPDILDFDPDDADDSYRSHFDLILLHLMVLMMIADDEVGEVEIDTLLSVFTAITGKILTRDEVLADASEAKTLEHSMKDYLPALAEVLTLDAKALLIQAVNLIAEADGELHDSESATLLKIAAGLEMSEADLSLALNPPPEN
jgi:uncharacterized tellurite resistance protein B-like protein